MQCMITLQRHALYQDALLSTRQNLNNQLKLIWLTVRKVAMSVENVPVSFSVSSTPKLHGWTQA